MSTTIKPPNGTGLPDVEMLDDMIRGMMGYPVRVTAPPPTPTPPATTKAEPEQSPSERLQIASLEMQREREKREAEEIAYKRFKAGNSFDKFTTRVHAQMFESIAKIKAQSQGKKKKKKGR